MYPIFVLYSPRKNEQVAAEKITEDCNRIVDWFKVNSPSANPKAFQVRFLGEMINLINFLVTDNVEIKAKKLELF